MPDDPNFELVGMTDGVDDTVRTLQTREVDVLLVACQGREDDRSLQIIDGAHRVAGDLPIIVLSTSSPNGFLRRAFDAGAADMALFPQTKEQLRFAMSKAIARAPRKGYGTSSSHDGRLVCVLGPKGGTGKTLTSCNLAVALALAGQKVLIIDLDLQFGDVGLCLGPSAREDDVRPRGVGRVARRGQAGRLRHDARHGRGRPPRSGAARPGERDHDRAPPRRPRRRARARTTT